MPFYLTAAFDTIDHNILITRLSSWFGIHGSVISWFKSYLSSRFFCVKCNNNLSSFHTSSFGVPKGSVLGHLLFVMYTTPLSILISSVSLDHQLHADDTQLYFSLHPPGGGGGSYDIRTFQFLVIHKLHTKYGNISITQFQFSASFMLHV